MPATVPSTTPTRSPGPRGSTPASRGRPDPGPLPHTIQPKTRVQPRGSVQQVEDFSWAEELKNLPQSHKKTEEDLETLLGDDEGEERQYDHAEVCRLLYMRKCRQVGVTPISLFLRHLQTDSAELNLRTHNCGPRGAQALSAPLVVNRSLVRLALGGNSIQDEGLRHLVLALAEDTYIQYLDLSENKLTRRGAKLACQLVLTNAHLRSLNLSGNHFGDSSAPMLATMIEKSRHLQELNLGHNDLGTHAGVHLGPAIAANDTLQLLDLSWNQIRRQGAISIAKGLKDNIRLRECRLGWNGFGVEGAETLGQALAENSVLQELDLTNNRLVDPAVILLAKGLAHNEALNTLILRNNPMTNIGALGILKAIQKNDASSIKNLDIKDVTVEQEFIDTLAELNSCHSEPLIITCRRFEPLTPVNPSKMLVSFLLNKEQNLMDLFPEDGTQHLKRSTTKEDFVDKIKSVGAPLSGQQLASLTKELNSEKPGVLDLSPLFQLQGELSHATQEDEEISNTSSSEAIPSPRELYPETNSPSNSTDSTIKDNGDLAGDIKAANEVTGDDETQDSGSNKQYATKDTDTQS